MPIYRITNWDTHFENSSSRKLKRLEWVAIPNKTDGEGYTALVEHENAAAHLGAWYAIVEAASKQTPRGMLPGGIPQDIGGICRSLGRMSRLPASVFHEVIPRLINIGWLECLDENKQVVISLAESADMLAESAGIVAESAGIVAAQGRELQGITGKGITSPAAEAVSLPADLRPQSEYPETLRVIQEHDRSVDVLFVQNLADTTAREIISHPVAATWTMEKQRKAVSDAVLARACAELYATPRKNPPGAGLLLKTVPRIVIGGKLNYV